MYDNSSALVTINKELDVSLDDLINKCNKYKEKILKTRENIISGIKSEVVGENLNVCKTLHDVHNDRAAIILLKNKTEQLKLKFAKFKTATENFMNVFRNLIKDLNCKNNRMMYLICLQCVVNTSNKIKTDFDRKHHNEAIMSYKNLCELSFFMNSSKCKHLLLYINQVIRFWHSVLEQYYSKDFEIVLCQIKWPFKNTTDILKLDHFKQNFQRLADILLKIRLPITNQIDSSEMPSVIQFSDHFLHISSPIDILVKPLRKRFFFHFSGKKQTNKPDKPEWFLSKVINWIRDYRIFILDWLGPVYKYNCKRPVDSVYEFIVGLLQCVVIKLNSDLQYFQLEDLTFSHIVDETLVFEHELKNVYGYPNNYPSITEVLSQTDIFFKWINLERKYANIKMDAILQNNNKWDILVKDNKYFITVCAENVLILLDALSDRYSILRQSRHKLQFVKLQNDLLEEFKQKIIDNVDENSSDEYLSLIICTLHYISYTLYNLGTNVHFLFLLNNKCDLENEVKIKNGNLNNLEIVETVFDDTINSYQLDMNRLLNTLCDNIMSTIIKNSKPYKRDNWHIMRSLIDENKYNITENSWIFYEMVSKNLSTLSQNLPKPVFNKFWPKVATKLSTFIYNDVLLDNMFNKGGAQHLLGDVRYKLLLIFSKYTTKPIVYTERLLEACRVLCFEPNFKPVVLTKHEVSKILLRRIEYGNSID